MKFSELWTNVLDYYFIIIASIGGSLIIVFEFLQLSRLYTVVIGVFALLMVAIKDLRERRKNKNKEEKDNIENALTDKKIENIEEAVTQKNSELEYKQKIITEFLKYGVIKEEDIMSSLNQEPFVILYHFNRRLNKEIETFVPQKKKVITQILDKLGFVPVGAYQGSYFFHVIGANSLPKPLDQIPYLEAYIRKKIKTNWRKMWDNMEKENNQLYQEYKEEKDKKVNFSYFLGKIFPCNLSIGYLNFSSFDTRFLSYYAKFTNSKTVEVNKQKLDDLLSLASISLFVTLVEPNDRKIILKNESVIRANLGVNNLLDYESVTEAKWTEELTKIFQNQSEKAGIHAKTIYSSVQKYVPVIKEFI